MEISERRMIPMQEKLKFSKSQGASTPVEIQCMQNIPYASAIGLIMYAVRCTRLDVTFAQNITSRFQQNPSEVHWTALRVSCYTDAGYLTDADDMKSQTGYVFVLNGGVVDWKSTKQSIFATSSTDAEYIAAFDALKEAIEKVDIDDNLADPFTKALAFPKHSELTEKIGMIPATASTTLVVNKEFVPPLDMCSKIPWALSRINQIIAWPCPKGIANYQYICKPATPTPKWELLEYGSRIPSVSLLFQKPKVDTSIDVLSNHRFVLMVHGLVLCSWENSNDLRNSTGAYKTNVLEKYSGYC
ncbi:hypothetical protein Tco_0744523 [Tanacetum coccineum]